jgi:hypothetical protein
VAASSPIGVARAIIGCGPIVSRTPKFTSSMRIREAGTPSACATAANRVQVGDRLLDQLRLDRSREAFESWKSMPPTARWGCAAAIVLGSAARFSVRKVKPCLTRQPTMLRPVPVEYTGKLL